jgi:hypothetical protein
LISLGLSAVQTADVVAQLHLDAADSQGEAIGHDATADQ